MKRAQSQLKRTLTTPKSFLIEDFEEDDTNLDFELFKPEPDDAINQGSRQVLSFSKNSSFENAFFIYPESEESLKSVLRVHVSVNLMNSYLPEITSSELGTSKERVKKI